MNQQQSPFLDNKGLFAIILIGVFFALWQWYMNKTYPPQQKPAMVESTAAPAAPNEGAAAPVASTSADTKTSALVPEKEFEYNGSRIHFKISNHGMGLKEVTLKNYTDRAHKLVRLAVSQDVSAFEMRWNKSGTPIIFEMDEKSKGHYIGRAESEGTVIIREVKYDETRQAIESTVEWQNASPQAPVDFWMGETITAAESSSFLFPSYDHQDFFVTHNDKEETINFSAATSMVRSQFKAVKMVSVSSQYFAVAAMDHSDLVPDLNIMAEPKKEAKAQLIYQPAQAGTNLKLAHTFFIGPKAIDVLGDIHPDFKRIINFGMLSVLADPMLMIMKTFHSWVANWGFAIILLTILVRFAVFPLYMMSTKSMKAMQKVQPMIQTLRAKYKDDPMTMNREMMALMKEHKANPIGGCLPMLLQIPIFFALFRVIGSSVELYQAPFGWWIQDLSLHDKFFVLPVLMGVTMYIQQKITPTAMDPAQAKILAFMPVIFSVFMLYLPSGLTLYMLVSAVFGIIQQKIMMRDSTPAAKI